MSTMTIVEQSRLSGTERITKHATVTVASVLLHGPTARWPADRYARWLSDHSDDLTTAGEQIEATPLGATPANP